ncbi:amino acid transporter [Pseudozyma hubeiensis SY62]|uniref:Amino acid transporter n=1 Tax=Pseudozyma hubeiensis (strain SY62) TaxID=1305764 RepID=R9P9X2_PSEHS|nr:amino acid transporter [Pseudozyma hubeiensis SY62]GAC98154.1 amino acid transporter [Pseudozyma hubeiensis SY62]
MSDPITKMSTPPSPSEKASGLYGESTVLESQVQNDPTQPVEDHEEYGLQKALKPRHLIFISIGACIGTGIFLGVGSALKSGGPLGLLIGYSLIASVVVAVMLMVCELTTFLPVSGGHIRLAGRFVDPALSAAMGWNYLICWTLILAAELSAAAVLISYWVPTSQINPAVWIAIGSIVVLALNAFSAGIYGEAEFWFASIKVITIMGLIFVSIYITSRGGPNGESIGFSYWRDPGPFVQFRGIEGSTGRFLGFYSVLAQASFSMIGAEMLALAAAECRNPRRVLPICLRTVWIRIVFFYIVSVFMIGLIVPSNNPRLGTESTAAASPFVIAMTTARIRVLPSIINAAIITSALSAGCSDLYTTSRALYALAQKKQAPKIFTRTTKNGVPHYAVAVCWLVGCLAYLGSSAGSGVVFNFLVNLTALSGILTWVSIAITYLRFRAGMRAQSIPRESLPWKSPLSLFAAYWTLLIVGVVLLFSGWEVFRPGRWNSASFFSNYLPLAWFPALYVLFKFLWKTKVVKASEMDFVTGIKEIEEDQRRCDEEDALNQPTTMLGKVAKYFE